MTDELQSYYHINKESYQKLQKHFEHYALESVAIYSKDILFFTLVWVYGEKAGTVKIAKYDKNADEQWQEVHISHYEGHKLGIDFSRNEILASASQDGWVNNGTHYFLHPINMSLNTYQYPGQKHKRDGSLFQGFVFDEFKTIDKKLFALGGGATWIIKRENTGDWSSISTKGLPTKVSSQNNIRISTHVWAFDAFSQEDIYTCGDDGNLWHFNGKEWRRIDIPTLAKLVAVVCVIKGRIIIFEKQGVFWIGEGNKWIKGGKLPTFEVYCATFFDNKIWVGTKLGSYILDLDDPKKQDFQELEVMPHGFSFFHDNGDLLVLGDGHRVTIYDKKTQEFEPFVSW